MTKEEIELARELVAEPEWSWHAGQEYLVFNTPQSYVRTRLLAERPNGKWVQYMYATNSRYDNYFTDTILKGAIPNLADPVTVDSLLTVARRACGGDVDVTYVGDPASAPLWASSYLSKSGREYSQDGGTFAQALLNVLRHVTSRAFDAVSAAAAADTVLTANKASKF